MTTTIPSPARKLRGTAAFTLTEVIIGASISSFLLAGVLSTFLFLGRSGANVQNYDDMEAQARQALEIFAQDTRQASSITWTSNTDVTMLVDSIAIRYYYDKTSRSFIRINTNTSVTRKLVTGIVLFEFKAYGITGATYTPFSSAVKNDNGSVGSVSVAVDSVLVQNADIWGYVSTNNADDPTDNVGANGSILGKNSVNDGTWKKASVDPTRVSTQFSANFDPVTMPTTGTNLGSINNTTSLSTGTYTYSSIGLASSKQLNITGDVVLLLTASAGSSAISITGNAGINIATGASLKIYTAGDISIAGNGVANGGSTAAAANAPIKFQIWGTSTSTDQSISIAGNGVLSGVVYAPNGDVKINGNGDVMGSVVAEDITLVGNAAFHYDESLGNLTDGNPFRVAKWKELTTAADRAAVASKFNF